MDSKERAPRPPPKDAVHKASFQIPVASGPILSPMSDGEQPAPPHSTQRAHPESFDVEDDVDAEIQSNDASYTKNKYLVRRRTWWKFWEIMTIRPRKISPRPSYYEAEEDEGLLSAGRGDGRLTSRETSEYKAPLPTASNPQRSPMMRRYALAIFYASGIFFIAANIWVFSANVLLKDSVTDPLANWGKPGTTSEGMSWYPTDFLRDITPIPCHSHNDYWRKVPLFSALYAGCISVEADVWDFGGSSKLLYVGHNPASLSANRTFQSLYINPLVEILERQNPQTEFYGETSHGVFDTNHEQSLTLLVDVKTDGKQAWPVVLEQLEPLRKRGWLTFVENGVLHPRPVTVVGTGETPFDILTANRTYRDAFFDSPLQTMWKEPSKAGFVEPSPEDSSPFSRSVSKLQSSGQGTTGVTDSTVFTPLDSYYASTSFVELIGIVWFGHLTDKQRHLIRGYIAGAHERGLKVRFWDTPSWPRSLKEGIWKVLVDEGVDVLNVDDLDAAKNGLW